MLSREYPSHSWCQQKFANRNKKTSQWWLHKVIKEVLPPNIELTEEYAHPFMKFRTGYSILFDVYVSSLNLAIEYHGYHHYYDHYMFGTAASLRKRDSERIAACKSLGITFIFVPYWWQRDKESIEALLHKYRPDLVPANDTIPFWTK